MDSQIRTVCAALVLLLWMPLAGADDLLRVYAHALDQDPTWAQAKARYAEVLAGRRLAGSTYKPQLSASARAGYQSRDVEGDFFGIRDIDRSDDFESFGYTVQLRQPVLRLDRLRALARNDLAVAAAEATLQAEETDLALRVADAYFATLDAEQALHFARAEADALAERAAFVRERVALELAPSAARIEAESQSALAQARELGARRDLDTARAGLAAITGRRPDDLLAARTVGPLPDIAPTVLAAWQDQAREANPMLIAARLRARTADKRVDEAAAQRWPTLDLVAQRTWLDNGGGVAGERRDIEDVIGLELTVPLYDGGATSARIDVANARHEQTLASLARVQRAAEREVETAFAAVQVGREQVAALRRARAAAYDAVEAAKGGFETGTRTNADVSAAIRDRYAAERDLSRQVHAYLLNLLRLEAAAGSLTGEDLLRVNAMLRD